MFETVQVHQKLAQSTFASITSSSCGKRKHCIFHNMESTDCIDIPGLDKFIDHIKLG